ncbi:MAG: YncE family protein [Pseudomonadota bacterium]|nr:YncE family protein [Pseudomonadota bacterium]
MTKLPLKSRRVWLLAPLLAGAHLIDEAAAASNPAVPPLKLRSIADISLGGHPTRLDYASIDTARHLLFIAHLGDSEVIVFNTESKSVIARIAKVSHVHGVLVIPELGRVYASATGTNEVVAIDETTFNITARTPGGTYPDGIAYAPKAHKLYVSDEHGGTDTVIDVRSDARVATIQIGGKIGNTQYDTATGHVFVNAQSSAELVEIDPSTDMIIRRMPVPKANGNHGLLIDSAQHRAFIACEGNDTLIVMDLGTGTALANFSVAKDPDVLALDPGRQDLYVAGESGQVTAFKLTANSVSKAGESFVGPNAHVVAVDPNTHDIYFPIMNVDGKTVLRIMRSDSEHR